MLQTRLAAVHALLSEHYPAHRPGAAIYLVIDDVPVLLAGYGLARVRDREPITPATLFDLASVAKHLTAHATLLLASRGLLAADHEVRRYLPEVAAIDTGPRPIRIGDLLYHTSGLPEYLDLVEEDDYPTFTNSRLLAWLGDQTTVFAPGTQGIVSSASETYCNTNYALLASLIERVSGMGYPEFLKRELFDPLGMRGSFCDPWEIDHPGQALRYDDRGRHVTSPRMVPVYGDGNVYSSLADFVRWDAELTRPTLMDRLWLEKAWIPGMLDDGRPTQYAWGWHARAWSGRRVVWHGGSWDGASNCFSRWLDDRVRIILFSNTRQHKAAEVVEAIEGIVLED